MKIVLFSYDTEIVTALLKFMMIADAPEGRPRGGSETKFKNSLSRRISEKP